VEEALRVLEEYGKLYRRWEAQANALSGLYLESRLLGYATRCCCDHTYISLLSPETLFAVVEAALQGGLTLVQYRDKTADGVQLTQTQQLSNLAINTVPFHCQRPVDLALAADADGVHIGQQDIPIAVARQLLGPQRLMVAPQPTRGNASGRFRKAPTISVLVQFMKHRQRG